MATSTTKTLFIGILLVMVSTALIVIVNLEHGLKIDVSKNETKFYIFETTSPELSGNWTLSGTESWKLYINGKAYSPSVTLKNTILPNNKTLITRTSKYSKNNATIIDTYLFDGNEKNIELFPIDHTISINNCTNCTYRYIYNIYSTRMKMTYQEPDKIQSNILFYNIDKNRIIKIRMFDPLWNVSGTYSYNNVSLDPTTAYTNSSLNCSVYANMKDFSNSTYVNGTNYSVYIWYFKNNVILTKYNSLLSYNTTPQIIYAPGTTETLTTGDIWHCRIRMETTSGSNITISPLMISNYVTILNSDPSITLISPGNGSIIYTDENTPVTVRWSGSDLNNDSLRYEVYGGVYQ